MRYTNRSGCTRTPHYTSHVRRCVHMAAARVLYYARRACARIPIRIARCDPDSGSGVRIIKRDIALSVNRDLGGDRRDKYAKVCSSILDLILGLVESNRIPVLSFRERERERGKALSSNPAAGRTRIARLNKQRSGRKIFWSDCSKLIDSCSS